jgi:putative oxidoreductase
VLIAIAVAHRYWTYEGAQWFAQFSFFNKNLAIIGGLLYIAVFGPGRYSVDKA